MPHKEDPIFRQLQKHLDKQAVGFPSAKDGSDIRILKHIFDPQEAKLATYLSWKHKSETDIIAIATEFESKLIPTMLQTMVEKGGIEVIEKEGERFYCNSPLVVGMYEMQLNRLSKGFIRDFRRYTRSAAYGLSFLSTKVPQMRTIPVEKSIKVENHVATFDQVNHLLDESKGPFVIVKCICREKAKIQGRSCKVTDRKETCLALGDIAQTVLLGGQGKKIDREEARDILTKNQKEGLILQPSNTQNAEFICSCCGCCCGMLSIHKNIPKPLDYWATNFVAITNDDLCNECGACVKRCQVDAIFLHSESGKAVVKADRCLGCGHCVAVCVPGALSLNPTKKEQIPPQDRDALYTVIAENKKGPIGKAGLAGKFIFDKLQKKYLG